MTYSEKVQKHFYHPSNLGELKNVSATGTAGNAVCGDVMEIYLEVEGDVIKDVKFKTFGCAAAVATVDMLCDMVKGKTIEEAKKIQFTDVVAALEGLPKQKIHCSSLSIQTLRKALEDYENKQK